MEPMIKRRKEYADGDLGCPLGHLKDAYLFSGLSAEETDRFQYAAQTRPYRKGKTLYLQEEPAEFFYVICSGWIKLFHTMPEGEEVIVDMLTGGDMFGESAIFKQDHHMCSAQVIEDAVLISIPANLLSEQIRLNSKLALNMLSSMSIHHRRHHGELAFNATLNAPQRIGCFLLRLCPRDEKHGIVFHLPYDKSLIADTLGMKSATFSRGLNILKQKIGFRINGTRVEIDSSEELANFVYGALATKYVPE